MKPEDVLAIAQEGNPKVIAAIINRTTEPHGIFVRVSRRGNCLYILLEGEVTDQQDVLVSFMQASLQKLQVRPINSAIIYGRQTGEISMAWSQHIKIPLDVVPSGPRSQSIPPFRPTQTSSDLAPPSDSDTSPSLPENERSVPSVEAEPPLELSSSVSLDLRLNEQKSGAGESLSGTQAQVEEDAIAEVNAVNLAPDDAEPYAPSSIAASIGFVPPSDTQVSSPFAQPQGYTEDSDQPKDVIRSEQGQIETLSLSLLASNRDELEQEDLQVGKKQQSMSTLEVSASGNREQPLDTIGAAEPPDQSTVREYAPDSITAKFNTLVGPLDQGQATLVTVGPSLGKPLNIPAAEATTTEVSNDSDECAAIAQPHTEAIATDSLDEEQSPQTDVTDTEDANIEVATIDPPESESEAIDALDEEPDTDLEPPEALEPEIDPLEPESETIDALDEESDTDIAAPDALDEESAPEVEVAATKALDDELTATVAPEVVDEESAPEVEATDALDDAPDTEATADVLDEESAPEVAVAATKALDDAPDTEVTAPADALDEESAPEVEVAATDALDDEPTATVAPEVVDEESALEVEVSSTDAPDTEGVAPVDALDEESAPEVEVAATAAPDAEIDEEPDVEVAATAAPEQQADTEVESTAVLHQELIGDIDTVDSPEPKIEALEALAAAAYAEVDVTDALDEEPDSDGDMTDTLDDKNNTDSQEWSRGPDLDKVDLDAFIRCPEALVLLVFTIAFFIWQTYQTILDDAAPGGKLTASQLGKRLGVHRSTISRRKEKDGFDQWAQSIDPDGLSWSYIDGFFVPHIES